MRSPIAALALALVAAAGCTFLLPSRDDKRVSFAPYEATRVAGEPLAGFLRARVCPLLGEARIVTRTAAGRVTVESNGAGSAVPIALDGYLLTAAHCLAGPTASALLQVDDGPRVMPLRVVWRGAWEDDADLDLAIVRVDGARFGAAWRWSEPGAVVEGTPLVAAGFSFLGEDEFRATLAAGHALAPLEGTGARAAGLPTVARLVHDIPVTFGDSGGPVATRDGRLVGLDVRAAPVVGPGFRGIALRPDPAWIEARIAEDRRAHAPPR
jgi:S1-C subfamily serine protease